RWRLRRDSQGGWWCSVDGEGDEVVRRPQWDSGSSEGGGDVVMKMTMVEV
ncbi:hypothetical protein Tco_1563841, partial [Tanacetum coccineum]